MEDWLFSCDEDGLGGDGVGAAVGLGGFVGGDVVACCGELFAEIAAVIALMVPTADALDFSD